VAEAGPVDELYTPHVYRVGPRVASYFRSPAQTRGGNYGWRPVALRLRKTRKQSAPDYGCQTCARRHSDGMSIGTPAAVTERPTCAGCGQRIGVYEPIWHITAAGPEATSLLRLPDEPLGELWHAACDEATGIVTR
jgi:hypothetical protein